MHNNGKRKHSVTKNTHLEMLGKNTKNTWSLLTVHTIVECPMPYLYHNYKVHKLSIANLVICLISSVFNDFFQIRVSNQSSPISLCKCRPRHNTLFTRKRIRVISK